MQQAFAYVEIAYAINPLTASTLHLARLAEELKALPENEIVELYERGIGLFMSSTQRLPLSPFWTETDLRQRALENHTAELPVDQRYRLLAAIDPKQAAELVSDSPQTATEWWVAGEHALTIADEPPNAAEYFSYAIAEDSDNGDYYVSRARATLRDNPDAADKDLDIAQLLGATYEYPHVVRAELAIDQEEQHELLATALPPRVVNYGFSGVLYGGRIAPFDLLPGMRYPGPGREAMQPWYTLAESYSHEGNHDDAVRIYRAILEYAPDETEALHHLEELLDE